MELTNEFVIDRNIEETWRVLTDLEFIAPCMPGAKLTEIEGDEYRGLVKIKVGPITANYKGKASFVEQDAENRVARLKAQGRDPRQGNANAIVTARMNAVADNQTNVEIHTDLGLSGKIASFGRGAIEDVSKKLLGQFTDNLRDKLAATGEGSEADAVSEAEPDAVTDAGPESGAEAESDAVDRSGAGEQSVADDGSKADSALPDANGEPSAAAAEPAKPDGSADSGGIRKIDGPEPEAVDLLGVAGGSMVKRALPAAGVATLVLAIIYWIIR